MDSGHEKINEYNSCGKVHWHCICPFCGRKEAVLFGTEIERSCRFCKAQWNEVAALTRFIEAKLNMEIQESYITGVINLPVHFPLRLQIGLAAGKPCLRAVL